MNTTIKPPRAHKATSSSTRIQPMLEGRHAESARRRQRVLTALDRAVADGTEIGVSAIARAALLTELDREFLLFSGLIVVPAGTVPTRDRRW